MDTHQLEYILAIAEEGNLSRAAERLFLSQSALSQQLAKLKAEGLPPLFVREKGKIRLTDAGKIYVNGARTILKLKQDAQQALDQLDNRQTRCLRLSISPTLEALFFLQVLPWLKRTYPSTQISTQVLGMGQIHRALENGTLDMALFPSGRASNEVFQYNPLWEDELVLFTAPGLSYTELPLLLPSPETHLRTLCDRAMALSNLRRPLYAEVNSIDIALRLTAQGACAALLPRRISKTEALSSQSLEPAFYFHVVAACGRGIHPPLFTDLIAYMRASFF